MKRESHTSLTVWVDKDTAERLKNLVYWTPELTISGFASEAISKAVARHEKKHGTARPRAGALQTGRPMK